MCLLRGTRRILKYVVSISGKLFNSVKAASHLGPTTVQDATTSRIPPDIPKLTTSASPSIHKAAVNNHHIIKYHSWRTASANCTRLAMLVTWRLQWQALHATPRLRSDVYLFACKEVKSWNVKVILFRHFSRCAAYRGNSKPVWLQLRARPRYSTDFAVCIPWIQRRTQEFCSGGVNKFRWGQKTERTGIWGQ